MASERRDFGPERSQSPEPLNEAENSQSNMTWVTEDKVSELPQRKVPTPRSTLRDGGIRSPKRGSTIESTASSILLPEWENQYVLSLDGGGIRGLSSLLIIQRLMDHIIRLERKEATADADANPSPNVASNAAQKPDHSSYHPLKIPPLPDEFINDDVPEEFGGVFKSLKKRREKQKGQNSLTHIEKNGEKEQVCEAEQIEVRARDARSKYLPCHYFDYMGGTSTGGLISIMLGRLRMPIDDAMEEYENLAGHVFGHPRLFSVRGPIPFPRDKYSGKRVVAVVNDVVGRRLSKKAELLSMDLFTSHEKMCKTIVVSYKGQKMEDAGYLSHEPPYLFRSYDHHRNVPELPLKINPAELNPGYSQRIPIWQVARATSAAPTYFDPITIESRKYGDGGFGSNNPVHLVYREVCQMNGNDPSYVGLLVSVGTGESPVSRFGSGVFGKYRAYLKAAKQLAADAETPHREMMKETNQGKFPPYFRFNVPWKLHSATGRNAETSDAATPEQIKRRKVKPLGEMKLDEWKPPSRLFRRKSNTTIEDIKISTEAYLSNPSVQKELEKVALQLVQTRRQRSRTPLWELFSMGIQFRCMHDGCHSSKAQKMRPHSNDLKQHLRKYHGVTEERVFEDFVKRGRVPY